MATPAVIRRNRKTVLRGVQASLRRADSELEKLERMIKRVLRVKKRFPDNDDAIYILEQAGVIDKAIAAVVAEGGKFARIVQEY